MTIGEERFADFFANTPAATLPLSTEPMLVLQNGVTKQVPVGGGSGSVPITIGGTPTIGGTNTCVLFQKGSVVGEDTNLEWDYTNRILHNNASLGIIQTPWFYAISPSGTGPALYATLSTDNINLGARFSAGLDANDIPYCGFGPGGSKQDALLYRTASFTLAAVVPDGFQNNAGAGWQVYNKWDYVAENFVTNYERAAFDWTSFPNILTIGTQKSGTGQSRNFQFVCGNTNVLDFGITSVHEWSFGGDAGYSLMYCQYFIGKGPTTTAPSFSFRLNSDPPGGGRVFIGLDTSDNPFVGFNGSVSAVQPGNAVLNHQGSGILGIQNGSNISSPASLWLYNISDTVNAAPSANYERGVFDWTTTTNVLTIGTQKGGTGSTRNIQFVVGNTNLFDYGITNAGAWTFNNTNGIYTQYTTDIGTSGNGPGTYVRLTGDTTGDGRVSLALDSANNPYLGYSSAGNTQVDTVLYRTAAYTLGVFGTAPFPTAFSSVNPAGFQVYNTANSSVPTNYERGVFDWTTTTNVLTIGTQAGGSGKTRPVKIIAGDGSGTTTIGSLDFDVTTTDIWTANTALAAGGLVSTADPGGTASTNTVSSASSTTISTGVGVIHMSTGNPATNSGWLKCYIGTQVAWIPCWTTNAP